MNQGRCMMVGTARFEVLSEIATRLGKRNILWVITGSTAFAL